MENERLTSLIIVISAVLRARGILSARKDRTPRAPTMANSHVDPNHPRKPLRLRNLITGQESFDALHHCKVSEVQIDYRIEFFILTT